MRGKVILLNTMILSKVTFISRAFPISKIIQKTIKTYIFKHIWQFSNKGTIARTTLFLPKNQGGIGLIHSLSWFSDADQTFPKSKRRKKPRNLDYFN